MSRSTNARKSPLPSRLPDVLNEPAVQLKKLHEAGTLTEVGRRFLVTRRGGFCGLDGFLVLLLLIGSGTGIGFRKFYGRFKQHWPALAALASRKALPTPSSLSRLLGRVEAEDIRPAFADWLLHEALDVSSLLAHGATQHRDAHGEAWHIYDFDPTVRTFRQRALPSRPELPEPRRQADQMGKPGRAGRKRGELVMTRSPLQHAGSGLWVHLRALQGTGRGRELLSDALRSLLAFCTTNGLPLHRTLVRADGEFGGVPSLWTAREAGVFFLTRCARYKLLGTACVQEAMAQAQWEPVPDSGSGPQREAVDVGWVLLEPSGGTYREDGSPYPPIRCRLVVSRYASEGEKSTARGKVIEGYRYELFVTDLSEDVWPPGEVVSLYFGRCGQEGRFSQLRREMDFDRILSYNPAGQEVVFLVQAFLWNLRTLVGFAADPPPDTRPAPTPSASPPPHPEPRCEPPTELLPQPTASQRVESRQNREEKKRRALAYLKRNLAKLFIGSSSEQNGWTCDAASATLTCPQGHVFHYMSLSGGSQAGGYRVFFRGPRNICAQCPSASSCRKTKRQSRTATPTLAIPTAAALKILGGAPPQTRRRRKPPKPPLLLPGNPQNPGAQRVLGPLFLPAAARHHARELVRTLSIAIEIRPSRPHTQTHRFLAGGRRERSHGRCTHDQNLNRYALPDDISRRVTILPVSRARQTERAYRTPMISSRATAS